ncbi:ATP-dependent zinc protease family protein [Halomonas cerina]|uniref:Retropepsin-like aspartic endopeptidase domain-containing protein n=1 Tax=Halomonas cerina TaxID=447424 RepID=A0A839V1A6_9GAMM|nr:ATP-dependent zinc protease [Halomonas cerina]MBB3189122.1 hypothetical protein [Halomonas cerina]
MLNRSSYLMALVGLALMGGCTWLPTDQEDPHDQLATTAQLDAYASRLEGVIVSQCADQQYRSEQVQRLDRMGADIREVGTLLRHLQDEVATLDRVTPEPSSTTSCSLETGQLANKEVLGRNEWVGLPDVGTYLQARVDTGARTSSLAATDITAFERDGENWVRFKLSLDEDDVVVEDVRDQWIEAAVERRVRTTQAGDEDSRPVIRLLMTLGPLRETVEFTLDDRPPLDYPVLLGRRFLMDIAVVDVAGQYLHARPEFPGGSPADEAAADEAAERDAPNA